MSLAELERGRSSYARQAWEDDYEAFAAADRSHALDAHDLERLATAAYLLGKADDYFVALERAYRAHQEETGDTLAALRCAFWIGVNLAQRALHSCRKPSSSPLRGGCSRLCTTHRLR